MTSLPQISLDSSGKPFCLSTDVASHFQKKHKHVLRDIENLLSQLPHDFTEPNFGPSEYTDSTGRKLRQYKLSRDGFTLLAMGFTGKSALAWKLRYIEAFNELEKMAFQNADELQKDAGALAAMKSLLSGKELEKIKRDAYEEGYRRGKHISWQNDRLAALEKIARYVEKGLSHVEIGRILGLDPTTVGKRIKSAKEKGFWPHSKKPVQSSLPGVAL